MSAAAEGSSIMAPKRPFRIRTITAFVTLHPDDFAKSDDVAFTALTGKIDWCNDILRTLEKSLTNAGYEVQTVRIATNPFGEWIYGRSEPPPTKTAKGTDGRIARRLAQLDDLLSEKGINFCSLGPSLNAEDTVAVCPDIVAYSGKFSCSANIEAGDDAAASARAAAKCMKMISTLGSEGESGDVSHIAGGLGNFRFCAASCVETVPFFPGAKALSDPNTISFAIGLENGGFACTLLEEAKSISNIKGVFDTKMSAALMPIERICLKVAREIDYSVKYLGIDTSLNPSLDEGGSVADAIECLEEVRGAFGGTGSLAAAAAITTSLQSIPDVITTGYRGLMLPVLEDRRLAELALASTRSKDALTIQKLLCISSVCGVGIDTVPIPGDVSEDNLTSLILDVTALAGRWNKPLSCRVFPVPGGKAGEETTFDSPYMCNSCIFDL
ncbi:hypothetical protein ACHAXT_008888 [Thalassiosira profunda]